MRHLGEREGKARVIRRRRKRRKHGTPHDQRNLEEAHSLKGRNYKKGDFFQGNLGGEKLIREIASPSERLAARFHKKEERPEKRSWKEKDSPSGAEMEEMDTLTL